MFSTSTGAISSEQKNRGAAYALSLPKRFGLTGSRICSARLNKTPRVFMYIKREESLSL